MLAGGQAVRAAAGAAKRRPSSALLAAWTRRKGSLERALSRIGNLRNCWNRPTRRLDPSKFILICAGTGQSGQPLICIMPPIPECSAPRSWPRSSACCRCSGSSCETKSRLEKFGQQLPEALELISRALRAGHSLASGINLVAEEMADPDRKEFHRCYESQNLGVPLEEALEDMSERVPNLDLRFFVTAVILQRQTGGDLAEILDKIGSLIRERFKIWGQIQALTGEGRLSGIVLLALPPALFVVMYYLNPEYCMVLFTDPMGHKMLAGAVVMQIVGALVIKKIINIKV